MIPILWWFAVNRVQIFLKIFNNNLFSFCSMTKLIFFYFIFSLVFDSWDTNIFKSIETIVEKRKSQKKHRKHENNKKQISLKIFIHRISIFSQDNRNYGVFFESRWSIQYLAENDLTWRLLNQHWNFILWNELNRIVLRDCETSP